MAGIRNQRHSYLSATGNFSLPCRAKMVFHVTGFAFGVVFVVLTLEFSEDGLVRLSEDVGQNADAPSMCHCDADFACTVSGSHVYGDIEHRDECVVSLDREPLV